MWRGSCWIIICADGLREIARLRIGGLCEFDGVTAAVAEVLVKLCVSAGLISIVIVRMQILRALWIAFSSRCS